AMRSQPSSAAAIGQYRARAAAGARGALAPLQSWVDRNPTDRTARLVLADALRTTGAVKEAISQYESLSAENPPLAVALNNLAWLYFQSNDPRALVTARRAYEAAPNAPAIVDTYGWILVQAGQVHDALPLLKQAAAAQPDPEIRYHYATALARTGATIAARSELEAILKASESQPFGAQVRKLLEELRGRPGSSGE